jgi:purine-nucleoside/S-methyl-5'-thioadenosine phosphorylase / adenosine deaminase
VKRVDSAGLIWFESELLAAVGVRACFSARGGGYSAGAYAALNLGLHVGDDEIAVLNNRLDYWSALGLDPDALVGARQVHGTRIMAVTRADRGKGAASWSHALAGSDGLVTLDRGVPIFGLSADCHLVALASPESKGVAVLHAGWRGLLDGILEKGAGLLAGLVRKQPEDLVAFVGPGLGENCFEVREDFEASLAAAWGAAAAEEFVRSDGARRLFRYQAAVRHALEAAGILPGNIEFIGGCTATDSDSYYSHRSSGGRTGRMALTAWIP